MDVTEGRAVGEGGGGVGGGVRVAVGTAGEQAERIRTARRVKGANRVKRRPVMALCQERVKRAVIGSGSPEGW